MAHETDQTMTATDKSAFTIALTLLVGVPVLVTLFLGLL